MYLLDLRDRMRADLEAAGRLEWAREEFQRLEGTRWESEPDGNGFLRIKGTRDLNRRQLALFRELVAWRDEVARELDRATFRVAGNEALLEVARQAPRTLDALTSIRGVPRGIAGRRGKEILDAVERGLAVPENELPRFPRAPRWERDSDFDARVTRLRAVREAAASRLALDPGVLVSRDRLEAIARLRPKSMDELLTDPDLRRWLAWDLEVGVLEAGEGLGRGKGAGNCEGSGGRVQGRGTAKDRKQEAGTGTPTTVIPARATTYTIVIPAKAGIHVSQTEPGFPLARE
jgi:ribonuclease D